MRLPLLIINGNENKKEVREAYRKIPGFTTATVLLIRFFVICVELMIVKEHWP